MFRLKTRRERETAIVNTMIGMYCQAHHNSNGTLCAECVSLSAYAEKRLLSCMFGEVKPVCKECPVHCYSPQKREQMKQVMIWAGPKMIFRNPLFAIRHMIDTLTASKPKRSSASKSKKKK
jgi:hypothetical protein